MKPPKVMQHLGFRAARRCECGNCKVCAVYAAAELLEKCWHDDTKKAKAVHDFIKAIKEAAQ
jgi:hypothetical protein